MDLKTFITAGNATFTVTSRKTGTRFTYKVRAALNVHGTRAHTQRYFVSVLTGPDNTSDYDYAGMLEMDTLSQRMVAFRTAKSRVSALAPSWLGFEWLVRLLNAGEAGAAKLAELAKVHHMGRCGRCNRELTVPESIESGLGPECAKRV